MNLLSPRRPSPLRAFFAFLLAGWLTTSCAVADGDSDAEIPRNFPTIASSDLHGRYEIIEAAVEGQPYDVATPTRPVVDIDVVTAGVAIELSCNLYLGSFTLDPDQRASFTLPGGTSEPCPDRDIEDALVAAFSRVDRWRPTADGLEISSSAGDRLILSRL